MYHAKKIGVFVSHIFGDYQKNVCQGIIDKAIDYGYIVEIFSTTDGENLGKYGIGENSILRIPNYDEFQGVIFASETYPSQELRDEISKTLAEKCTCPIIEINQNSSSFPTIVLENNITTGQIVDHLISIHNHKRICYLGCSNEKLFSSLRINAYRVEMKKKHLPVGEYDTYDSVYSETSIEEALSFFLTDGKPDAIVCYNDRMALILMLVLLKAGYSIPNDIVITGCDNLEDGKNITPKLTTVTFPVYELGVAAIEQLIKILHKQKIPTVTTVYAEPIFNSSCGCKTPDEVNSIFYSKKLTQRIDNLESSIFGFMRMSASFQGIADIDEGMDLLADSVAELDNCSEFYLCLYTDWDLVSNHIRELTLTQEETPDSDTILLKLAIKNGKRLPECSFTKKSILPDFIYKNSHSAYIYTPLFFEEKEFGYTAIAYEKNQIDYHFQLIHWQQIINQMLESIYDTKQTVILVKRLEDLYLKDLLTGLCNLYGFNRLKQPLIDEALNENDTICCFIFDLDGLKTINDNFGHQEGDFAMRVIAHALESTTKSTDICARFSGDEFYLLTKGYTEDMANNLIEDVHKYLAHYNQFNSKPYNISVSEGYAITKVLNRKDPYEINDLINEADKKMYAIKKSKHTKILKN